MNKRSLHIIILSLFLCLGFNSFAQLDSRNRTPETVVTDGLAQLPTQNPAKYNEVIGEMAATGQKGIEMLAAMLKPAATNQNAAFEYAIDAIVSFVTREDNTALRQGVHDGLVAGLSKCTDDANRAFLLTQLNKVAGATDAKLYTDLVADPYLGHIALIGLAAIPGVDDAVLAQINAATTPNSGLAYVAYFRKLAKAEPKLIEWAESTDPKVLEAVYNALAACGSEASIKVLQKAAKAQDFGNDPTGATDAYLRLLAHLGDNKAAISAEKNLLKCKQEYVRCAALGLLLKADKANAQKNILAALKDKSTEYRNTALLVDPEIVGDGIYSAVAAKYKSLSPAAKIDVINWLGNNHVASQADLVSAETASKDPAIAMAAIAAASKIGGDKALATLINLFSADEQTAKAAENALHSFNGDINTSLSEALNSQDANTRNAALRLIFYRRAYNAYDKVFDMVKNGDAVAATVLPGIAKPENFNEICDVMEKSDNPAILSSMIMAATRSLAGMPGERAYFLINDRMESVKAERLAALYYPMLASTATPQGIEKLYNIYCKNHDEASLSALLTVNDPFMINILYTIAVNEKPQGQWLDKIYGRMVELIKSSNIPEQEAYTLYNLVLERNPNDDIQTAIVRNLGNIPTFPSLMTVAAYLNKPATSFAAANSVRNIVAKNEALQKGKTVKGLLESARKIFAEHKANGDADAGYAIDDIDRMLGNMSDEGGFADVTGKGKKIADDAENFELYFDWNPAAQAALTLRSMPLITLDPAKGLTVYGKTFPAIQSWNTVYIKMINDRIFVDLNGKPVIVNEIVNNVPAEKAANYRGEIAFDTDGASAISNVYLNNLPDTPIFTLSPEEEAEGFEVLFDGRSLDKWHGNTNAYVPVDGNIYVTAQYGGSGNLYTKKNYSDFIYRFEFWFDVPAVNNGIGIRTGKDVTGVDAAFHGMEIQVLDHDDPVYGGYPFGFTGIKPYQQHGSVYGVIPAKHVDFGPIKQWHTEEIKAIGDHITVTVDGEVILDGNIREVCQGHAVGPEGENGNPYMLDHRNHPGLFNKEGYISFCGHGSGVKFRNVRILDLSDKAKAKKAKKANRK